MNNIFEEIKSQLNIRQVVEFYGYKVNRQGKFLCPFHNDHNPTASIKGEYFNCFACGAAGDLIKFVALLHNCSNYDAAKILIHDFNLNIATEQRAAGSKNRLRGDREIKKRQRELKEQKELEELIQRVGFILADYHRYLWRGIQLYPLTNKRHIRGLQELTRAQYYLELYDENNKEFTINNIGEVKKIERRLAEWNNER